MTLVLSFGLGQAEQYVYRCSPGCGNTAVYFSVFLLVEFGPDLYCTPLISCVTKIMMNAQHRV